MDSEQILTRLYARPRRLGWLWRLLFRRRSLARRARADASAALLRRRALLWGSVVVLGWTYAHLHYYNQLVDLEFNVQAAWAQVEALQQRRHNIQKNLTSIARRYSQYEKGVLTGVTELRTTARDGERRAGETGGRDAAPTASARAEVAAQGLDDVLARIQMVAEEYPELHLTENLQQFSAAIVSNEAEIAQRIMGYNEAVNVYTTALRQFPSNVFGQIAGFEPYPFYDPGDRDALRFQGVDL